MVYFYQLFLNADDVILKLYTSLCQKAKCTLFGALYMYWPSLCSDVVRGRDYLVMDCIKACYLAWLAELASISRPCIQKDGIRSGREP